MSGFHKLRDGLQPVQDLRLHARLPNSHQHQEGRVFGLIGVHGLLAIDLILGEEAGDHQLLLFLCHLEKIINSVLNSPFPLFCPLPLKVLYNI